MKPRYSWDWEVVCICFTVSIATPTTIIKLVPPIWTEEGKSVNIADTMIGNAANTARYVAPSKVTLNNTFEICCAVASPGLIPGI